MYGNEQQGRFLTVYPFRTYLNTSNDPYQRVFYGAGLSEDITNKIFKRQLGNKAYELKDHLGNVRVTFSDIKMPTISPNPPYNRTQPFRVDLLSKSEYYPYGMQIEDLSYQTGNSRYSYNSQEKDVELNKNMLSAEFWEYDARSTRRWNLDPVDQIYRSNYSTFANNPITYNDLNGDVSSFLNGTDNTNYDNKKLAPSIENISEKYSGLEDKSKETTLVLDWKNSSSVFEDSPALSRENRIQEGKRLAQEFYQFYNAFFKGEDITLIGYSYGGDVAMHMAEELDNLLEGKVKINIVSLSTPLDNTVVCELMYRENIVIDHYYVENDRTVATAAASDDYSNLFLMNGKSLANFHQTFISIKDLKNINSDDYDKLEYLGNWDNLYHIIEVSGGNHGWPYYKSFIDKIIINKRINNEKK